MAEEIFHGKDFSAIMTYNKPKCPKSPDGEHDWSGDGILTFHHSDKTMSQKEYEALPDSEKKKLSIASGEASCALCGIGYMSYDNPHYL